MRERARWLGTHWKAAIFVAVLTLVGFGIGAAAGSSARKTDTTTVQQTLIDTTTTTRTVRLKPRVRFVTKTRWIRRVAYARPPSGIYWNLGDYAGTIALRAVNWRKDEIGYVHVLGQAVAPGGCGGYVEINATFLDSSGSAIDTGLGNFESLPAGVGVPFDITSQSDPSRVELVVTSANC